VIARRPLIALASMLALAAGGTATAGAAELHWYRGGVELLKGAAPLKVPVSGKLTVLIVGLREIKCQVTATEELWNPAPAGFGEDALGRLSLGRCSIPHGLCPAGKAIEVLPEGLPWHSALFAEGDGLAGVSLEVRCKAGHTLHLFEGSLSGPVGSGLIELAGRLGEAEPHREAVVELSEHLKARHGKITAH